MVSQKTNFNFTVYNLHGLNYLFVSNNFTFSRSVGKMSNRV
jgi:hypothetical protein